jgi:regulator of sigma E protease
MSELLVGNNPLAAVIAFFVVLIPLILIHELGHFLAGKSAGIAILEFGIGFPPRIVKLFTWRETDVTLNWLPLGGFVRPLGEDMIRPVDESTVEKDREELRARHEANPTDTEQVTSRPAGKAVNEASRLGRILFFSAGALANFLFAFVLFVLVALMGIPQTVGLSLLLTDVKPNSMFAQAGLKSNDAIVSLNGETFASVDDFFTKLYALKGQQVTLTVQHANAPGLDQITITPNFEGKFQTASYVFIAGIAVDSPAQKARLQPGDIVTAFNGETINGVDDFRARVNANLDHQITITVERQGKPVEVSLVPRSNPPEGQGAVGVSIRSIFQDTNSGLKYQVGAYQQYIPLPFGQAVRYGADSVAGVISNTIRIPSQIISGAITAEEARPVSVIGISQIGASVIDQSIQQRQLGPILNFIAVISVALGFFNLLPIPALDGGRILFVLIEIVRGRPISPEREGMVHLIGLALLLSLSVIIILNDLLNPITNVLR